MLINTLWIGLTSGSVLPAVRVGVDVGGTNTDAVIFDTTNALTPDQGLIAFHKTATSSPVVIILDTLNWIRLIF